MEVIRKSTNTEQRPQASAEKNRVAKRQARKAKAKAARQQHAVPSPSPAVKPPQYQEQSSAGRQQHDQSPAGSACFDGADGDAICRRESDRKKPGRKRKKPGSSTTCTSSAFGSNDQAGAVASGGPKRGEARQALIGTQSHKTGKRVRQHGSNGSSGARDDAPQAGSSCSVADEDDGACPAGTTTVVRISSSELPIDPPHNEKSAKKKKKKKRNKNDCDAHGDTSATGKNVLVRDGHLQQHPSSLLHAAAGDASQKSTGTSHANNGTPAATASSGPTSKNQRTRKHSSSTMGDSSNTVVALQPAKEQQRYEARQLSKVLESVRKRHRAEIGKGRRLIGWDVAAFAKFSFEQLLVVSPDVSASAKTGRPAQREEQLHEGNRVDDEGAVAAAVAAVAASAEEEHAGEVQ